ncbi:MAG TPA: DNA mismatch repair protein MutS [Clostridia bacterium]|nr:DNA mismatch repair protein MutS [Clostridia bacterium]
MSNKLSPMMEHYKTLKESYPDTILLYRLGDFYEMFFEDALTASKVLDLTLTGRDCGLEERAPMCGVPHHAVDTYIARLISAGYKVAICEQLSNPGDQKGMVKRDVIRVITPGTVTDEEMLDISKNNYLAGVYSDKNNYAVAWIDITTGEFNVKEFFDVELEDIEDFLLNIGPSEIIAPRGLCPEYMEIPAVNSGKLVRFTPFYDYAFSSEYAKKSIEKQFNVFSEEGVGLGGKPLAINVVGALIDYINTTQKRSLEHITSVKYVLDKEVMYLDYNTKKNLELTETLVDNKKFGSLIWVIDRTKTGMGARHLRNWLLNPLQNVKEIENRQQSVAEFIKNTSVRSILGATLIKVKDIERLVTKIAYGSVMPRDLIALKESLLQIPKIKKCLDKCRAPLTCSLNQALTELGEVTDKIEKALYPEQPPTMKDGGYINDGYSAELDELRKLEKGSKGLLAEFEARQRNITGVPSLKVGFNRIFGYYIEITKTKKPETLPADYVRKQTIANGERYTCDELIDLENKILTASERILTLESDLYNELKEFLFRYINVLQRNAYVIAVLDCLFSLAEVAAANDFVMPKFVTKDEISIIDGRHPVVEALLKANEFVSNDTTLNSESRTMIITGPNMAGKSTYIRQVALIVLLAHIGSFVPAKKAEMCVVDRIFTRIGASDNLTRGQSTFMVEMLEVANILNNATSKSLLILDEIGRGTSTLDGLSIAWSIIEYVALKLNAKTLFATHYHELSELERLINGIRNYRILVQEREDGISFLYKIARGGANKSFGIEVAQIAGVNKEVIRRAKDIMNALSENHELSGNLKEKMSLNPSDTAIAADQMSLFGETDARFSEIERILKDINVNRMTPIEALTVLNDLKKILEKK